MPLTLLLAAALSAQPRVDYSVEYRRGPEPHWRVSVSASGLDPSNPRVALFLPDWGEWTDIDSLYVRDLKGKPAVRPDPGAADRFLFDLPERWDGTLTVSYSLPALRAGSRAQQSFGLLPFHAENHSVGYAENTLMVLEIDGEEAAAERTLALAAPRGWKVMTGWGGLSDGRQALVLRPGARSTVIAFGKPTGYSVFSSSAGTFEAVQFIGARDVTAGLVRVLRELGAAYGQTTGAPAGPLRAVVSAKDQGGTSVEGCLSLSPLDGLGEPLDPWQAHFLAHELFHYWLPGRFAGADVEATAWIHEGFTEYLSLWHLAKLGLVSKDWFARRLSDFEGELARNPAWGEVSVADPGVSWREQDNEEVAYKGGALLALAMDVELRRQKRPGLMALLRDHLPTGSYSLESVRAWMTRHGLGGLYERSVAGRVRPRVADGLKWARADGGFFQ